MKLKGLQLGSLPTASGIHSPPLWLAATFSFVFHIIPDIIFLSLPRSPFVVVENNDSGP